MDVAARMFSTQVLHLLYVRRHVFMDVTLDINMR